ncbi:MAG TPA: hypothetical protein PLX89_18205 [Verrucomicrobiota bacterium]|nr:hypothetical protein [Verrucomicrobiales bacterium]HRI14933.1 hypothetical protein [Verrucomicrobiota bacterium]
MKNITLSAHEDLIENARAEARVRKTTLNQMFRDWLEEISAHKERGRQAQVDALFDRVLERVDAGRKFTREEMNER